MCVLGANRELKLVHALHHSKPAPRCLVFVNSPYRAKRVCDRLWEAYGIPAAPLYGRQEREERVDVMRRLVDGRVRIAVATEMGARGLDLPGLTHVVNLELPTDPSHYVHRAGRCGRAGEPGTVLSLVQPGKAFVVAKMTKALGVELHDMQIKGGAVEVVPGAAAAVGGRQGGEGAGRGRGESSAARPRGRGAGRGRSADKPRAR